MRPGPRPHAGPLWSARCSRRKRAGCSLPSSTSLPWMLRSAFCQRRSSANEFGICVFEIELTAEAQHEHAKVALCVEAGRWSGSHGHPCRRRSWPTNGRPRGAGRSRGRSLRGGTAVRAQALVGSGRAFDAFRRSGRSLTVSSPADARAACSGVHAGREASRSGGGGALVCELGGPKRTGSASWPARPSGCRRRASVRARDWAKGARRSVPRRVPGRRAAGRPREVRGTHEADADVALEREHEVADVDLVAFLDDQRPGDLAAVDVGAVGALEVDDDEAAVLEHDARVALRHVALGQARCRCPERDRW